MVQTSVIVQTSSMVWTGPMGPQTFTCKFLNNGLIFNLFPQLESSQSPLYNYGCLYGWKNNGIVQENEINARAHISVTNNTSILAHLGYLGCGLYSPRGGNSFMIIIHTLGPFSVNIVTKGMRCCNLLLVSTGFTELGNTLFRELRVLKG